MTSHDRKALGVPALAGAIALVGALSVTSCAEVAAPGSAPTSSRASVKPSSKPAESAASPPAGAEAAARGRLNGLRVETRPRGTLGYFREAFGPSWVDIDGNGCNQRDDVLLRDARPGSTTTRHQGRCDHDVLAGTWADPYTGRTLTFTDLKDLSQAQAIQIDHIVPLAEAWVSGANAWSEQRRGEYANTLSVLLAVDGPSNARKGADDPAAWRPRKGFQCRYAIRWIGIKHAWKLAVDPSEVRALGEMLDFCA